jgi:hypothetical protein
MNSKWIVVIVLTGLLATMCVFGYIWDHRYSRCKWSDDYESHNHMFDDL